MELIQQDVLDIAQRLKEIDRSYKLYFNNLKNRFEVHSSKRMKDTLEVTWYDRLDERLINKAKQTRVENAEKYLKQMEQENEKLINSYKN